jgi:ABC-2 type transporter
MGGLAPHAANFFKYLLILVLYTIAMALFVSVFFPPFFSFGQADMAFKKNFLLGSAITDGNLAILLSALSGLYQMTYAGFFVHLNTIPQVLRWLQWMDPLKYALEALTVNEVNSGLQIKDVLQGVPVDVSASLIMHLVRECIFISTSASRAEWCLFFFLIAVWIHINSLLS